MLEVKSRAAIALGYLIVAVLVAVPGGLTLAWVKPLGVLWWILCVTLVISGAILVVIGIYKLFDRRAVLVVDAEGVFDRVTNPARRFAWSEVKGFRLSPTNTPKPQVLAIDVVDSARAIREAALGVRTVMQAAELHHGSPCIVWLGALDIEPNLLLAKLRSAQQQHAPRWR